MRIWHPKVITEHRLASPTLWEEIAYSLLRPAGSTAHHLVLKIIHGLSVSHPMQVLWLNGGPGCSSFDGFLYEHGPFNINFTDDTYREVELSANPYSWSKAVTMIYLDSPSRKY
jgi:hypothetical protein